MRSSRRVDGRRPARRRAAALLLAALVALLALAGCAAGVRRGEPPASVAEPATPPAPQPSTSATPRNAAASASAGAPGALDPSEAITPQELASIPDPVPGAAPEPASASGGVSGTNDGLKGLPPEPMDSVAPGSSQAPSGGGEAASPPEDRTGGWVWRVQIFASESRAEAERVAEAAGRRLGTSVAIVTEGSLHKVRLGGFATEAEAMTLRERALDAGYAGAFRVKTK